MSNENSASVTYSVRVPHWVDEELMKFQEPGERKSDVVRRAILAFITKDTDD